MNTQQCTRESQLMTPCRVKTRDGKWHLSSVKWEQRVHYDGEGILCSKNGMFKGLGMGQACSRKKMRIACHCIGEETEAGHLDWFSEETKQVKKPGRHSSSLWLCSTLNSSFPPSIPPSSLLPWVCGFVHVVDACNCVGACSCKVREKLEQLIWNHLLPVLPYCLEVGTELDTVHFSYAGWLESSGDPSVFSP